MQKLDPKVHGRSPDFVAENVARLKELFPEVFTEDKVDVDALRQILGDYADERVERYGLNWTGKSRARQIAQTPSSGTLRPAPDESVEWATTQNVFIEGDNLEVLKLLQKSYHRRVKMIYIDPPYNTGKEFIYPDRYQDNLGTYLRYTGQVDGEGLKVTANAETNGRYHTNWLNMIYPRLKLARNLLRDDGVILVSIDDNEYLNLRHLLDEIFGPENFLATLIWNKQHSQQQGVFKKYHEYVLVYARNAQEVQAITGGSGEIDAGAMKKVSKANPASEFTFPAGTRFSASDGFELEGTYGDAEKVTVVSGRMRCQNGRLVEPVTLSAGWTQKNQMTSWFGGNETFDTRGQRVMEFYFNGAGKLKCRKERGRITPPSLLPEYGMVSAQTEYLDKLMGAHVFDTPKPVGMLRDFVSWFSSTSDVIIDFFAGSGTTGEAVWQQGDEDDGCRRFILVQLPEPIDSRAAENREAFDFCMDKGVPANIAELTKERLRRAADAMKGTSVADGDFGFRVFKLDSTNIKPWDGDFDNLEPNLLAAVDNIKHGRSEDDVLYELLLKYGLDLSLPIDERIVEDKRVFILGAGALVVCLAADVTLGVVEGIGALKAELQPEVMRVVFRDASFTDDVVKTNAVQILKRAGIDDIKSL